MTIRIAIIILCFLSIGMLLWTSSEFYYQRQQMLGIRAIMGEVQGENLILRQRIDLLVEKLEKQETQCACIIK